MKRTRIVIDVSYDGERYAAVDAWLGEVDGTRLFNFQGQPRDILREPTKSLLVSVCTNLVAEVVGGAIRDMATPASNASQGASSPRSDAAPQSDTRPPQGGR